ncbi:DUF6122 family protein [Gaetbulibacter aestuarii]|uniref:DUF6122 family protein n=1 Tax=Gaetbulibacter aestuarii TaxID=1502358 RepID=A0ABW7MZW8_9FLAO
MLQNLVHYGTHLLLPLMVALVFYPKQWKVAYVIMLACILIDVDHVFATPIFDPNRCSINFHPLHQYWAIGIYVALLFFKKTRLLGLGLLIHILADVLDCSFM